jgi:hypothetical protein
MQVSKDITIRENRSEFDNYGEYDSQLKDQ